MSELFDLSYELFSGDDVAFHRALSALKCYERFAGGYIAFQRGIRFYFGPVAELSALFSGNSEAFLTDDEAEAKVAELHAQQAETGRYCRSEQIADGETLIAIRKRWEQERRSG